MSKFGSIVVVLFGIHVFCVYSMDQYIHKSKDESVRTSFRNPSPEYIAQILFAVNKVARSRDFRGVIDISPIEVAIIRQLSKDSKKQSPPSDQQYDAYASVDY
jgi:hypothetical protein